jgi:hypothetical protein
MARGGAIMKIAFLLGAGFSIPAGVPSTSKITEHIFSCENVYRHTDGLYRRVQDINAHINRSEDYLRRIKGLIQIVKEEIEDYYLDVVHSDYERTYYIVRQIQDSERGELDNPVVQAFIDRIRDRVTKLLIQREDEIIRFYLLNLASETLNYITGHLQDLLYNRAWETDYLDRSVGNAVGDSILDVDIFTLNHDEVLEQYLVRKGIQCIDGFGSEINGVRYWKPETYRDDSQGVRLFKLHGSINWCEFPKGVGIPLNRDPWHSRNPVGDYQHPDLSRPGLAVILIGTFNKMLEYTQGVFAELYYLFRKRLQEVNHLVICGYGFGDKGINNSIIDWFRSDEQNKVVVIEPYKEELRKRVRPAARRFLFPEMIEEEIRYNDSILTSDPNSGVTERPIDPPRKWEIIPLGIDMVNWEMIMEQLQLGTGQDQSHD